MKESSSRHRNDTASGGSGPDGSSGNGLARVIVRRFDPTIDKEPYYQEYRGLLYEARSVLDVLHAIYEEQDSSLAFRRLCTRGFCGSCFMLVNGVPALACQARAQAEMVVEPHPKFPVIRDLVVDTGEPFTVDGNTAERSGSACASGQLKGGR